jgi:hypothetical protein
MIRIPLTVVDSAVLSGRAASLMERLQESILLIR